MLTNCHSLSRVQRRLLLLFLLKRWLYFAALSSIVDEIRGGASIEGIRKYKLVGSCQSCGWACIYSFHPPRGWRYAKGWRLLPTCQKEHALFLFFFLSLCMCTYISRPRVYFFNRLTKHTHTHTRICYVEEPLCTLYHLVRGGPTPDGKANISTRCTNSHIHMHIYRVWEIRSSIVAKGFLRFHQRPASSSCVKPTHSFANSSPCRFTTQLVALFLSFFRLHSHTQT